MGGKHSGEVVGWGVKVDLGHCVRFFALLGACCSRLSWGLHIAQLRWVGEGANMACIGGMISKRAMAVAAAAAARRLAQKSACVFLVCGHMSHFGQGPEAAELLGQQPAAAAKRAAAA